MHLLQVYDIYDTAQLRSHRVGAHVYNMQEYLYKFINFVPVPGLREGVERPLKEMFRVQAPILIIAIFS